MRQAPAWQVGVALAVLALAEGLMFGLSPMRHFYATTGADPELWFGYTPADLHALFAKADAAALAHFRQGLWVDYVFTLVYAPALAFSLWAALWRIRLGPRAPRYAVALAIALALVDWLEDALLLKAEAKFPDPAAALAQWASVATMTKLALLVVALALLALSLAGWIYLARRAPPRPPGDVEAASLPRSH